MNGSKGDVRLWVSTINFDRWMCALSFYVCKENWLSKFENSFALLCEGRWITSGTLMEDQSGPVLTHRCKRNLFLANAQLEKVSLDSSASTLSSLAVNRQTKLFQAGVFVNLAETISHICFKLFFKMCSPVNLIRPSLKVTQLSITAWRRWPDVATSRATHLRPVCAGWEEGQNVVGTDKNSAMVAKHPAVSADRSAACTEPCSRNNKAPAARRVVSQNTNNHIQEERYKAVALHREKEGAGKYFGGDTQWQRANTKRTGTDTHCVCHWRYICV